MHTQTKEMFFSGATFPPPHMQGYVHAGCPSELDDSSFSLMHLDSDCLVDFNWRRAQLSGHSGE